MLRDLLEKEAKDSNDQEKAKLPLSNHQQASITSQKDDNHSSEEDEDAMNIDASPTDEEIPSSPPGAGLQRMSGNLLDLDDEADHSFLHPLMGHLQGRLLGRGAARNSPNKFAPLHPYTQVLSLTNLEECVRIESEAFPEHERCSQEKFIYRLTKCPELCFGIFSRPTLSEVKNSPSSDKAEMIALIICTRTPAPCVTDASMEIPPGWQNKRSSLPATGEKEPVGHQDQGGTICIHSLAVGRAHQRKGLGSVLLKAFTQRIKDSKIADRIALIAHDHLLGFYKSHGFEDMGPSAVKFGGGGWRNLVMEFSDQEE